MADEALIDGSDLMVVFQVLTPATAAELFRFNLADHERVIVRDCAAFHLAELHKSFAQQLSIGVVLGILA